MSGYDPKEKVALSRIAKRGDWITVEGHVGGRKVEAHIPAPTFEGQKSRAEAEALARRTLLGTELARRSGEDRERD